MISEEDKEGDVIILSGIEYNSPIPIKRTFSKYPLVRRVQDKRYF
mgnify:CR=1 FL=1